jgi:hypothetical protein
MNCDSVEFHRGVHAFDPDGNLHVVEAGAGGATWVRFALPWTDPPDTVLNLSGTGYPRYLPRVVAGPGGGRLLVRGPMSDTLGEDLVDLDASGGAVQVTTDAISYHHLDFAAVFDGATPYALVGHYAVDATVTLDFLQGPDATGGAWTSLDSLQFTGPPPPTGSGDTPVQGTPLALVREANGDLVGYELTAGLLVLSGGTLTRPALTLPHPSVTSAAATLDASGQAVVFLLAEDTGTLRLDRITHAGGVWAVESVTTDASWAGLHLDIINDQVAPIDDSHVVVQTIDIGNNQYNLYSITRDAAGTWTWEVPCTSYRCDNVGLQHGYTRIAVAPGPTIAMDDVVISKSGGAWTGVTTAEENESIFHPCETCAITLAPARTSHAWWIVAIVVALSLRSASRRRSGP